MNKTVLTILSIIILVGVFVVLYQNFLAGPKVLDINKIDQQTNAKQNLEPKTDEQVAVTITVTPIDVSSKSKEWKFNVVMNTHVVELNQDLTKNAVLADDQGKEYKPIKWEGPVGGHHREGILIFNQITPTPKSVELKISGIGDVIRNFVWQL
ncbi:MAG: hypothetical protein AAB970_01285 [Patescibacteria group bacterium]